MAVIPTQLVGTHTELSAYLVITLALVNIHASLPLCKVPILTCTGTKLARGSCGAVTVGVAPVLFNRLIATIVPIPCIATGTLTQVPRADVDADGVRATKIIKTLVDILARDFRRISLRPFLTLTFITTVNI